MESFERAVELFQRLTPEKQRLIILKMEELVKRRKKTGGGAA